MDGARLIAKALKDQAIEYVFGVVGIPIIEVSYAIQGEDIKFVGMRNEQAVSWAYSQKYNLFFVVNVSLLHIITKNAYIFSKH